MEELLAKKPDERLDPFGVRTFFRIRTAVPLCVPGTCPRDLPPVDDSSRNPATP
jgi:hypothetical protein